MYLARARAWKKKKKLIVIELIRGFELDDLKVEIKNCVAQQAPLEKQVFAWNCGDFDEPLQVLLVLGTNAKIR